MSVSDLATKLDALDAAGYFVTEAEDVITVSDAPLAETKGLLGLCDAIGWDITIQDKHENVWSPDQLAPEYAPYTLVINKPGTTTDVLRLVSCAGFMDWLSRGDDRRVWQIGALKTAFRTYAVAFEPWDSASLEPNEKLETRAPRRLVREATIVRQVPDSMNRWLLTEPDDFPTDDSAAASWANLAALKLMLALPTELDGERQILRFSGPPRLDLSVPSEPAAILTNLTIKGFLSLQAAVDWVFELEREAEMRHILLATELARSRGGEDATEIFLKENIADALAGAKTAYQMQLAGMSGDALKALSDLRKAISEDTAKTADGTRQIITAVAGALAVGVGMIAVRLSSNVNPDFLKIVLGLAATYVAITILSGALLTRLQQNVRKAWQPRLYRFLPTSDYDALVSNPAKTAERALWGASALGVIAILTMFFAMSWVSKETVEADQNPQEAENASATATTTPVEGASTDAAVEVPAPQS